MSISEEEYEALKRERDGYREEYWRLKHELVSPPPGWYQFGSHIDTPDVPLEFWGDEGGVPIWERPREPESSQPAPGTLEYAQMRAERDGSLSGVDESGYDGADDDDDNFYREVFGRDPEPWREHLGALRLTLWDDTNPPWQLRRAREECEALTKSLNEWTKQIGEKR